MNRDIIVIGASWGGVTAIKRLVKDLPAALDATVFVVQHIAPHSPGLLAENP
jgi:two-component system chemotaxis response regulator CheB